MAGYVSKTIMDPNNNPQMEKRMRMSPEYMSGQMPKRKTPDPLVERHGPIRVSPESMHKNPALNADLSCICYRKTTGIFCFNCRYRKDNVRIRRTCPTHPNYLWLMDLPVCPKCQKDTHLTELTQ